MKNRHSWGRDARRVWAPILAALACAWGSGCGRSSGGALQAEPITPPERQFLDEIETTSAEIAGSLRSPSHTVVISKLGRRIRTGMTAAELQRQMGAPDKKAPLFPNPFTKGMSEWTFLRRVKFVQRPEQEPEYIICRIIVVMRNGRVVTWHEM